MSDAVSVFVGCDPNDCDLEQMMVLEYSLRKHASLPVSIHWMRLSRDPASPWFSDPQGGLGWNTEQWVTPFSGFRWAIPALCSFTGRALYMDADMLVLRDIAELWRMPLQAGRVMSAKGSGKKWRFCVTLWDCAAARPFLPDADALRRSAGAHRQLIREFSGAPHRIQPLHPDDNNIDGEGRRADQIRILHYSDIGTQFSHRFSMPRLQSEGSRHWFDGAVLPHPRRDLQSLWEQYYHEALAAGYRLDAYRGPHFGAIAKASQANYQGNRLTRRSSLWTRLSRRLHAAML